MKKRVSSSEKVKSKISLILSRILSLILTVSFLAVWLVSSVRLVLYSDFDLYRAEYEKYGVLDELNMTMGDTIYVTREMMAYLNGEREELKAETTVDGIWRDFFNEQDRLHMKDVKQIFDWSKRIWFMAGLTGSFSFVLLLICFFCEKTDAEKIILWKVLWKVYRNVAGLVLLAGVAAGGVVSRNFDYWFTWFHEKVFTNRLWMFDAEKDYMIRMLPEGFFSDMATWSLWIFGAGAVITGGFLWVKSRREIVRSSMETFRIDN